MDTRKHLLEWLTLKRLTTLSTGEDVEELKLSYIFGGNIKCYQHFGRVFQICKKLNICLLYDPAILFVGFYPREKVAYAHIDMYKNSSSIYSTQQMELIHIAFNW